MMSENCAPIETSNVAGEMLYVPTVQECSNTTARWIEISATANPGEDLEMPAPGAMVHHGAPLIDSIRRFEGVEANTRIYCRALLLLVCLLVTIRSGGAPTPAEVNSAVLQC